MTQLLSQLFWVYRRSKWLTMQASRPTPYQRHPNLLFSYSLLEVVEPAAPGVSRCASSQRVQPVRHRQTRVKVSHACSAGAQYQMSMDEWPTVRITSTAAAYSTAAVDVSDQVDAVVVVWHTRQTASEEVFASATDFERRRDNWPSEISMELKNAWAREEETEEEVLWTTPECFCKWPSQWLVPSPVAIWPKYIRWKSKSPRRGRIRWPPNAVYNTGSDAETKQLQVKEVIGFSSRYWRRHGDGCCR